MTTATTVLHDCRDAWSAALAQVARADPRVVAVVNDSVGSSKLDAFRAEFPTRTINVGIAEQDMVGVAAGLANGGRVPFVSAAACFLTARAMEQIKVDIAYSGRHVVLVGQSPGMAYGELGPTHHSIEDLAWLRTVPCLTVVAPADPVETTAAVRWAAQHDGPVFLRVSRSPVPDVNTADYTFVPGRAVLLRAGSDVTLAATGTTVHLALAAARLLADEGIDARVLSFPTVKPIDEQAVVDAATGTRGIVTVEEALVTGLGGAIAEVVVRRAPVRMRFVGMQDELAVTGSTQWLLTHYGIDADGIAAAARQIVEP